MPDKLLKQYKLNSDGVAVDVKIVEKYGDYVRSYLLAIPEYGPGTEAMLDGLRKSILTDASIKTEKMLDPKFIKSLKEQFRERGMKILDKELPGVETGAKQSMIGILIHEMLGLGKIEFLLADGFLEEIVINTASEPVWVYHKEFGWLKTNICIAPETEIQNYASIIARRVGKQITVLTPLLDAHLITGDRANATLFPISGKGNTVTIRRFRRDPWTVTDFIENRTTNAEIMAVVWMAMQYELNIILSGGTASGKTSMLNVFLPFTQPNHRIISIEDTRELNLPSFLHWVPMTTRAPNPEGKGGVSMLDLLVNSLRMRPDRIIVGEIRRQREAEVMFEAMHTGHSVYTTFHANTADETIRRFTNPPVDIPPTLLESVHLNIVMFRNRRLGVRRILELAEFIPEKRGTMMAIKSNSIYRWKPSTDAIEKHSESIRFFDELSLHTGLTIDEIGKELRDKQKILEWMVKNKIRQIENVGQVMAKYYMNPDEITELVRKGRSPTWLLSRK